jgi:PPK2 family polyphosphate:nucleotide phosphotransferase
MLSTTVKPGTKIKLKDFNPDEDSGLTKEQAIPICSANSVLISELAYRLWAEHRRSLLIVLQGMDTSGKDGAIKHIISCVNPQSCPVFSFKTPVPEELSHDFLWRIHQHAPQHGQLAIFNRSHYEDVLIVRVRNLVPEKIWSKRYAQINHFEHLLFDSGTIILKFFFLIGKDEQRKRLQKRVDDPDRQWKVSLADMEERKLWSQYTQAYEDALTLCNTEYAPWNIIPSNRKWHRNLLVNRILLQTLRDMDPKFPKAGPGIKNLKIK